MENKPLERWHGAHHYSDKVHWLFVIFLFLSAGAIGWSYIVLGDSRFTYKNNPTPSAIPTPITTCTPRPSCLDTFPRCMIAETEDMCPPTPAPTRVDVCDLEPCLSVTPKPTSGKQVFCTQDAKLCPDGSYVGRTGPNCEFKCPVQ